MQIVSSAFNNNEMIPSKYTCDGENINPPLEFIDVPESTQSLVLIMHDPDAPAKDWLHWIIWDINPQTTNIVENSLSDGIIGQSDFGSNSYGGPCPPSGTHRYIFELYALDTILSLSSETIRQEIEQAMYNHILNEASLIGLYARH